MEKARKKKRPTAPILFKTVFEEYVKARRSGERCRRLRASTLKRYRTARNAFQVFVGDRFGQLFLDEIDAASLTRFLETEAERVSATTANATLETIAQVLKFAHKHHFVMENVAEEVERLYDGTADVADHSDDALIGWPCPKREEVRQIILHAPPTLEKTGAKACDGRPIYRGIGRNDYTNLYAFLSRTGLRIGEARFLTWDDVDFERKVINIRPGMKNGVFWQPKTRASIRRIPIITEVETILTDQRARNRRNKWVFETRRGTQLSPDGASHRFREICDSLGFDKRYVVHSLRKYWASTVAQQGMDSKVMIKIFGHVDMRLILSTYYSQNDDELILKEAQKIQFGL